VPGLIAEHELAEVPAYGRYKRLKRCGKSLLGRWHRPGYDVRMLLYENRPCYKKVVFGSAQHSERIFANLEAFRGSPHFPTPMWCRRGAVVVDFVLGQPLDRFDTATRVELAKFYAAVFDRRPRLVPLTDSGIWDEFEQHLNTLERLAVVSPALRSRLREHAAELAPERIWMGFDYTDPVLSNMVVTGASRSICAVDIKNLRADQPLGIGLAKGRSSWLTASDMTAVFVHIRRAGAPDIAPYFEFIRLLERVRRVATKRRKAAQFTGARWLAARRRQTLTFTDLAG
jgi:hypothetical protein